ncbi:MAG: transcriptional regulator [Rhodospirillales bacterium CG15_BIG_FIL_POST_REV_8_21_14_020_66_15]|nr:MAG: transcriptional regulator [Rhodospirillales bacterium CG15_BIG_FIL_POST_REV_8_21_14_020_66_15]
MATTEKRSTYHYKASGLDNVILENVVIRNEGEEDEMVLLPRIEELHRVIALGILTAPSCMSGKELRFLRTEMGLTQEELGATLPAAVTRKTVNEWETGKSDITSNMEFVLRQLIAERLKLKLKLTPSELAEMCGCSAETRQIRIDTKDMKIAA